jgi:fatty-acyl-CoA synthase
VLKDEFKDKVTGEYLKSYYQQFVKNGMILNSGVPDKVNLVDAIAKTSGGKINKKALRNQYA